MRQNDAIFFRRLYYAVAICMLVVFLGGCTIFRDINPIAAAVTVEQKAYASYGTFVVFQRRAVLIVRDKSLPISVRRRVQNAERLAKPAADIVISVARDVIQARNVYEATQADKDKLIRLIENLSSSLGSLSPKLTAFIAAVNDADKRGAP